MKIALGASRQLLRPDAIAERWPFVIRALAKCSELDDLDTLRNELRTEAVLVVAERNRLHPVGAPTNPAGSDQHGKPGRAAKTVEPKPWKPTKRTLRVIELMKQGLSDDAIAERQDVKVETSAANLRKIRQRARDNGYLPRREAEKRDVP
jgi:DNA-binding NarL/FixJ family response regulator